MNSKKTGIVFVLSAIFSLLTFSRCPAMPEVIREQLPNRLKLLVFQEHSIPAVTLELLVAAGSSFDPPGMEGLANLTARSLSLGTGSFSSLQINQKLDFMGATYGAECGKDFVTIGMQVLKKDLDAGVGLFTEIVEHPTFPAGDVALEKDEVLGRVRGDEDNPLKIANMAFDEAVFLGGPYAGSVQGGKKSVEAIAPGLIPIFYNSFYRPNNAVLVIGGDITPEEVKTRIIPKLLGWQAGPVQGPTFPKPTGKGAAKVVIDKPVSQAAIIIGCSAMNRTGPDYYPFVLLNQILGAGDLSSRLMTDIRSKRGLAYAVGSRLTAYKKGGSFRVVLQTANASAKRATALVQEELERLRRKPVSDAELKAAKEFLTANLPLRYSLPRNLAKFLAESEFHGLGPDYLEKYPALIEAVTAGDIQRVAAKYLASRSVVVIVGDLKKINGGDSPSPPGK